jgi:hypothetical protein
MWECGQEQRWFGRWVAVHISTSWVIAHPVHHVVCGDCNHVPTTGLHLLLHQCCQTGKHLTHPLCMFY